LVAKNITGMPDRDQVNGCLGVLLQFCFFVVNVLASDGVIFLNQHLVRRAAFIFSRGVKVTGSRGRL
jgi:hypothetical protein